MAPPQPTVVPEPALGTRTPTHSKPREEDDKVPEGVKRGRGRPLKISIEAKKRALRVRRQGGTWKEVAKVLYSETYPSPRHVKDAPKVLAYYEKSAHTPKKS